MFSGHIYLKFFKPLLLMDDPHLSQYFTLLAFISLSGILKMQVFIPVTLFQRSQVASSFFSLFSSGLPSSFFSFLFLLLYIFLQFLSHQDSPGAYDSPASTSPVLGL